MMQYIDAAQRDRERRDVFAQIATSTLANAGGTYQHKTGAPVTLRDGYVVGVATIGERRYTDAEYWSMDDARAIAATIEYLGAVWPETLPKSAQYIGTWISDGVLYADAVTVYSALGPALAAARRNGEQAVYDVANDESVYVAEFDGYEYEGPTLADVPGYDTPRMEA